MSSVTKIIVRDDHEKFLVSNIFIPKRMLYFGSDHNTMFPDTDGEPGVDFWSAGILVKNLLFLDSINSNRIYIFWNSPGGDWNHGIAIYDTIKALKSPVTMIGYCYVRSMGTIVMQACNERLLMTNTGFMIHDGEEAHAGIPKTVESWARESVYSRKLMYKIYYDQMVKKHGKRKYPRERTLKQIEEWCGHDTIFRAEQVVALGLADKIIKKFPNILVKKDKKK